MESQISAVAPPLFTDDDELRENAASTPEEIAASTADMCGLAESLSNCTISEDEAMPEALYMLDRELENISSDRKGAFLEAQRKCPDLVDDTHKEAFLWAENLDPKLAAQRLGAYWEFRRELFGPAKCFMPMTLQGAMRDDVEALTAVRMHILPAKDVAGRAMIFYNPPPDFSQCNHESLVRALCYMSHTLVEDPEVQKRGIIFLIRPGGEGAGLRALHIERLRFLKKGYLLENCSPVRVRAQHIIKPISYSFALRITKAFMGRMMRQRLVYHGGSDAEVLLSLGRFGVSKDWLPSEIGGDVILDKNAWIASRIAFEVSYVNSSSAAPPQISHEQCGLSTNQLPSGKECVGLTLKQLYAAESMQPLPAAMQITPARCGRKADPRMNCAVSARLNNPDLSLLDALLVGGFTFVSNSETSTNSKRVVDSDGVTLVQRKNQLLRRLRSLRHKN